MKTITFLSKYLFYPLWDIKDKSVRLKALGQLEKTQWLPKDELRKRQWKKLKHILEYSYQNCEYYKNKFDKYNIRPSGIMSQNDFRKLPVLTKKDIQDNTDGLISRQYHKAVLISAKTGGSTGKALKIYFDKSCEEMRNAAAMRSDRWAGWDLGMKKAAIWGNPPVANTWKKKIRNLLHDRIIYLDTMNLNPSSMNAFIEQWQKYKSDIIFGHAHSIFMFAKFILAKNRTHIKPKGIISSSMMLIPSEREIIEKAFGCMVTNRYGCEEVGLIACECEEHNGMHLNIDHLYVEVIKDDGSPADPGEEGAIVITDLINKGMPLIRYKIEDVGVPTSRQCSCGRGLPLMEKVAGRVADFLVRKDGSLVAGVSLVERTLTAITGIQQMQIVQADINDITLNIVTNEHYDENSKKMLVEEFRAVFGKDLILQINSVDNIPQERSGKYRFSICNAQTSYSN